MRNEKECMRKISTLIETMTEVLAHVNGIEKKMINGHHTEKELEALRNDAEMAKNQTLELYANIKAIQWCLEIIDDTTFATRTGTQIIENKDS